MDFSEDPNLLTKRCLNKGTSKIKKREVRERLIKKGNRGITKPEKGKIIIKTQEKRPCSICPAGHH